MKKLFIRKDEAGEVDLIGLVNKMREQLISLEQKVDILINRPLKQSFKNNDRLRERNFTQAVCSECGKECEIPFKPTGDRPVYCRDCFSARNDSRPFKGGFSRERKFGNLSGRKSRSSRPGKRRGSFFQKGA